MKEDLRYSDGCEQGGSVSHLVPIVGLTVTPSGEKCPVLLELSLPSVKKQLKLDRPPREKSEYSLATLSLEAWWKLGIIHFYCLTLSLAVFTGYFTLGLQSNYLGHMENITDYKIEIGKLGDFQLFLSLLQLGHSFGSVFAILNLYFCHRWIILASLVLFLLLVGLEFLSSTYGTTLYCVCQMGQGFAAGLMNKTTTFYIHDISPVRFRKFCVCTTAASGTIGVILGKITSFALLEESDLFYNAEMFRVCLLYKCVTPVVLLLLLGIIPKSPFVVYRENGYHFGPQFDFSVRCLYPQYTLQERCQVVNEIIRETQVQVHLVTGNLYSPVITIDNLGILSLMTVLSSIIMCRIFCFRNADLFGSIGIDEEFGSLIFSVAVLIGNIGGIIISVLSKRSKDVTLGGILTLVVFIIVAGGIAKYDQHLDNPCLTKMYTYLLMGFLIAINSTFAIHAHGFFPSHNRNNRIVVSSWCSGVSWFVTFLMSVFFKIVSSFIGIYSVWIILICLVASLLLICCYGETIENSKSPEGGRLILEVSERIVSWVKRTATYSKRAI
ncbi:hypothetical protein BABINDRAFT_82634 [Babjeviella inositovora NRRL Y-12698]|uniref:Major facilitator superfamily (MFS) profile domain-containing protein n=1 Tax=Babjeviella inositovora NRRL Y-12698 TaxID=984486 RepID=A0A1E3R028_9ASCO|nr:uncharacterized protein BABINDRAFT_82634 [Babjeviella inositovora NRRL Y-12698]ODQ83243.1 hypothetical protein BABINDRAFT_82634 [Babjeviella inositovora NRRL Y-12698]